MLELGNVMLPVKKSREVAPCREVALDRLTVSHPADGHSRKVSAGDKRALSEAFLGTKEASEAKTDTSLCLGKRHTTGGRQRRHNRERDRSGSSLTDKAALRRRLRQTVCRTMRQAVE